MSSPRVLAAFALLFIAAPLLAQSDEIGLWGSSARVGSTPAGGATARFDRGKGVGVSWNHFVARHVSTELAATQLQHDGQLRFSDIDLDLGQLRMKAFTGTVQWHVAPGGFIDPYFGAGAAYVTSADLDSADLAAAGVPPVDLQSRTGFTANAGLNFNITGGFGIGIDARYIRYEPDSGASSGAPLRLKLNPTVLSAGARLRF